VATDGPVATQSQTLAGDDNGVALSILAICGCVLTVAAVLYVAADWVG
jgi:hypothetical protein